MVEAQQCFFVHGLKLESNSRAVPIIVRVGHLDLEFPIWQVLRNSRTPDVLGTELQFVFGINAWISLRLVGPPVGQACGCRHGVKDTFCWASDRQTVENIGQVMLSVVQGTGIPPRTFEAEELNQLCNDCLVVW